MGLLNCIEQKSNITNKARTFIHPVQKNFVKKQLWSNSKSLHKNNALAVLFIIALECMAFDDHKVVIKVRHVALFIALTTDEFAIVNVDKNVKAVILLLRCND